jgi:hypothetical protein
VLYGNSLESYVVASWLRHYDTSHKVAGSRPNDVNEFFSVYLILLAGKITFLESREQPVHRADKLTAVYEPIV